MDALGIIETVNVLQAMLHHQQLLDLYHAKTHQDSCYIPIQKNGVSQKHMEIYKVRQ